MNAEEEVAVEVMTAAVVVGLQPSHSIHEVRDKGTGHHEAPREVANTNEVDGEEGEAIEAEADGDAVAFRNLKSISQSEHQNSLMLSKFNQLLGLQMGAYRIRIRV